MIRSIKKVIKDTVFPLAYAIGGARLLREIASDKKMIILYHGICDSDCFDINLRHLTAKQFEQHLLYYKKNFNVVSLAEIAEMRLENKIHTLPTVALTFDDGYLNNLDVILPLLEKYKVPATFFVTTAPLEKEEDILNCELIEIGCAYAGTKEVNLGKTLFKKSGKHDWISQAGENIYDFFQNQSPQEKSKLIEEWKKKYKLDELVKKVNRECYGLMNKEQIKKLSASPLVEIGSHAHSHHYLTLLTDEELNFELSNSKKVLEEITGRKVESIAFPNGRYNEKVMDFCRKQGYKKLVSVGLNNKSDKKVPDLFPRVDTGNARGMAFNMINLSRYFSIYGF